MKRIGYIDGKRIFLADGHALSFGTNKDANMWWQAPENFLFVDKKTVFGDVLQAQGMCIFNNIVNCAIGLNVNGAGIFNLTLNVVGNVGFSGACEFINLGISRLAGAEVYMGALPLADPHAVGRLWNNAGVVTVSAG